MNRSNETWKTRRRATIGYAKKHHDATMESLPPEHRNTCKHEFGGMTKLRESAGTSKRFRSANEIPELARKDCILYELPESEQKYYRRLLKNDVRVYLDENHRRGRNVTHLMLEADFPGLSYICGSANNLKILAGRPEYVNGTYDKGDKKCIVRNGHRFDYRPKARSSNAR